VRQVLGTLRGPAAAAGDAGPSAATAAPRSPAPGLDRLPELVAQAKDAGLDVRLVTEGTPRPLPQGVELAGFRIVQEALTNILRHSAARSAEVRVGYPAVGGLELTVRDPGPASAGGGSRAGGSGSGLTGMRERAAALGGRFAAGPRTDGGFEVRAELPSPGAEWLGRIGRSSG
jgi:signal transduction histidine kinase